MDKENKTEEQITYRDVLRLRNFRISLASGLAGRFADSIDAITFSWLVYSLTGSASWSALVFAMNKLPTVLLMPVAGVLVERYSKKKVCVVTNLIRAAAVCGIAALCYVEMIRPWIILVFTLLISCLEAFEMPASAAMMPKYLEKKYYQHAVSLKSALFNAFELVGTGMAGVIIGLGGISLAWIIDAASFFFSGLILTFLRTTNDMPEKGEDNLKQVWTRLKDGFRYVFSNTVLKNLVLLALIANGLFAPLNALQSAMAVEVFGLGSDALSVFGVALIIGMAVGAFIIPFILKEGRARRLIVLFGIPFGMAYCGLNMGVYAYGDMLQGYCILGFWGLIMGVCLNTISGILGIQYLKTVDESYLARASATMNASTAAATPAVSFLISAMGGFFSVTQILLISGILTVVLFLMIGIFRVRYE